MKIRQAKEDDAETVGSLVHRLLVELTEGEGPAKSRDEMAATAAEVLGDGAAAVGLLAENDEGEAVGLLMLSASVAIYAGGVFGEITELYIDPRYRSSGLGATMIEAAERVARERGWPRLEVGAPDVPRWQRTVDFYTRYGFVQVGPRLKLML